MPHLHWHVIPRYLDDAHFPSPVWAESRRAADPPALASRTALLPRLREVILAHLKRMIVDAPVIPDV